MKKETSGNIYKFQLEHNKGYCYAELLDFSDISDFDGILVQVYDFGNEEDVSIDQIKASKIIFGPAPMNKYPNERGRGAWKYIGKSDDYCKTSPFFKSLRGIIIKDNNWSNLSPWFKIQSFEENSEPIPSDYEAIRYLETKVLNHPDSIRIKLTMMKIIKDREKVSDYYDLDDRGELNMYLQIVNTYYSKEKAEELLKQI